MTTGKVPFHAVYSERDESGQYKFFVGYELASSPMYSTLYYYWILYLLPTLNYHILRFRKTDGAAADLKVNCTFTTLDEALELLESYAETESNNKDEVSRKLKLLKSLYPETFTRTNKVNKIMEI